MLFLIHAQTSFVVVLVVVVVVVCLFVCLFVCCFVLMFVCFFPLNMTTHPNCEEKKLKKKKKQV